MTTNNRIYSLTTAILSICMSIYSSTSLAARNSFTFQKQPINPACLALINSSQADWPYIYTINMDKCQNANATYDGVDKGTKYTSEDGSLTYSYRVIGKTHSGIFVIETYAHTGGTAFMQDVILCRLDKKMKLSWNQQHNKLSKTPYTALVYLGTLGGGDRKTGSYKRLQLTNTDHLVGKRYNFNNPATKALYPDTKVNIDLSHI